MTAYVISEVEFLDRERVEIYRKLASESVAAYGGRYLVRGGASELIEGGPTPKALVIVEFPSGLIHSDDSQTARSSSSSRYESRNCRQGHTCGSPSA